MLATHELDGVPDFQLPGTWTTGTILSTWYPESKRDGEWPTPVYVKHEKLVNKFLSGRVFFNHFITLECPPRPSTLLKAFNRGAAFMTEENTKGVDFIIPVILSNDDTLLSKLGPLFGEWTEEQEAEADKIVSYILIDVKDRKYYLHSDGKADLKKVVPCPTNFNFHKPQNAFISLILSCGDVTDNMREGVGVVIHDQFVGNHADLDPLQIPITAFSLSKYTFQCLDSRPNIEYLLRKIRAGKLNPFRGLRNQEPDGRSSAQTGREYFPLTLDPGREWS